MFTIFKNGDTLWAWDSKKSRAYKKEAWGDGVSVPEIKNLAQIVGHMPFAEILSEQEEAPDWLPKLTPKEKLDRNLGKTK